MRAVRLKQYMECANWDKSVQLGTETHYRPTFRTLREARPESHVTADISIFIVGKVFRQNPISCISFKRKFYTL